MATRNLLEAATLIETTDEGTWRVKLINEGKGSSGIYPASTLEKYHSAFNDALSFENHPNWMDGPEGRNFTQIVGKVVGETWVALDEQGKTAIYANWEPDPAYRERLSRYKKNLGMSIYIEGDGHIDENGDFVVDFFQENDPYKSVDVVIAAGRGGKFVESLQKMYSGRTPEDKPSTTKVQEGKENKMDEKDIKAIAEAVSSVIATALEPLVSAKQKEAEEAAQVEADEKAVAEARKAAIADAKAVAEAELSDASRTTLMNAIEAGTYEASMLESAKALEESIRKSLTESAAPGRILGGEMKSASELGKVFG